MLLTDQLLTSAEEATKGKNKKEVKELIKSLPGVADAATDARKRSLAKLAEEHVNKTMAGACWAKGSHNAGG